MSKSDEITGNNEGQPVKDNRRYPRVEHNSEVILVVTKEELLNTTLQDISPDGLQVRFDNDIALAIKPLLDLISDNTIKEFEVRFTLSMPEQEQQIITGCRPIYIMKIDQNLFGMGMQFTVMNSENSGYIQKFIEY